MPEKGIIELSYGSWPSPIVVVKSEDGSIRLFVDYRLFDCWIIKDSPTSKN